MRAVIVNPERGVVAMPWEYKTVRVQREEFVLAAQQGGNFSALCREFGISRKTGYCIVPELAIHLQC